MRLVREFIDIGDYSSLDELIETLQAIRQSLPEGAEAELRMRGDDIFGRHLSISYFRPQTSEEASSDARYADAYLQSKERQLAELKAEVEAAHDQREPQIGLAA